MGVVEQDPFSADFASGGLAMSSSNDEGTLPFEQPGTQPGSDFEGLMALEAADDSSQKSAGDTRPRYLVGARERAFHPPKDTAAILGELAEDHARTNNLIAELEALMNTRIKDGSCPIVRHQHQSSPRGSCVDTALLVETPLLVEVPLLDDDDGGRQQEEELPEIPSPSSGVPNHHRRRSSIITFDGQALDRAAQALIIAPPPLPASAPRGPSPPTGPMPISPSARSISMSGRYSMGSRPASQLSCHVGIGSISSHGGYYAGGTSTVATGSGASCSGNTSSSGAPILIPSACAPPSPVSPSSGSLQQQQQQGPSAALPAAACPTSSSSAAAAASPCPHPPQQLQPQPPHQPPGFPSRKSKSMVEARWLRRTTSRVVPDMMVVLPSGSHHHHHHPQGPATAMSVIATAPASAPGGSQYQQVPQQRQRCLSPLPGGVPIVAPGGLLSFAEGCSSSSNSNSSSSLPAAAAPTASLAQAAAPDALNPPAAAAAAAAAAAGGNAAAREAGGAGPSPSGGRFQRIMSKIFRSGTPESSRPCTTTSSSSSSSAANCSRVSTPGHRPTAATAITPNPTPQHSTPKATAAAAAAATATAGGCHEHDDGDDDDDDDDEEASLPGYASPEHPHRHHSWPRSGPSIQSGAVAAVAVPPVRRSCDGPVALPDTSGFSLGRSRAQSFNGGSSIMAARARPATSLGHRSPHPTALVDNMAPPGPTTAMAPSMLGGMAAMTQSSLMANAASPSRRSFMGILSGRPSPAVPRGPSPVPRCAPPMPARCASPVPPRCASPVPPRCASPVPPRCASPVPRCHSPSPYAQPPTVESLNGAGAAATPAATAATATPSVLRRSMSNAGSSLMARVAGP